MGEQLLGGLGLHDHEAEPVGDDVVQLPGDPGALLGGGELGLPLQFALQGGGPALDGRQAQRPLPHEGAEAAGEAEVDEGIDELERLDRVGAGLEDA